MFFMNFNNEPEVNSSECQAIHVKATLFSSVHQRSFSKLLNYAVAVTQFVLFFDEGRLLIINEACYLKKSLVSVLQSGELQKTKIPVNLIINDSTPNSHLKFVKILTVR